MNIKSALIEKLKSYILPMLLGAAVAYDIFLCYYYEKAWLYTAIFFVEELLLFPLFDWLKSKKYIGTFLFVIMFAAILFFSGRMVQNGFVLSHVWFYEWFYLDRDNAGFVIEYFYALFVGGGFFLISILYYFTQVHYRSLGSMLCILFPFVIYAKRAQPLSELQIAVLITLFLAVMVHNRQSNSKTDVKIVMNLSYLISIALFVSFVGAVAMLMPRPEIESVLEKNSHAFDLEPDSDSTADYSKYTRISSARYGASYTNEILFYFESDYDLPVYYLKRQGYDSFYNERWHIDEQSGKYETFEYYKNDLLNRNEFYEQLKILADSGKYKKYGLTSDKFTDSTIEKSTFRVYDDDFNGFYIPAPSGVVAKTFNESFKDGYFMYGDGEIAVKDVERSYDYTLEYYPETSDYLNYAKELKITGEDYAAMLEEAFNNGDLTDLKLLDEYRRAVEYYTGGIEFSDEMERLALELTKDCTTDYEKAQVLCNYFEENNFVYDLEYVPKDESIDYFVFESKTGSCTSYATAMTLMARICGLPAKYVEGFAAYEHTDSGAIAVRDAHAHAYVEIYIPGAGWITFDPTVPGYMIDYSKESDFDFTVFAQYLSKILVFLGVVFFVVFILLLDRIIELIFRIRLRMTNGPKKIVILYSHIKKLLEFSSKDDLSPYTVNMLIDYTESKRMVSVKYIAELFEKVCFGGFEMSQEDFDAAYLEYKAAYKYLRKIPKVKEQK